MFTKAGLPTSLSCSSVCGGRVREKTISVAWLLPCFQETGSFSCHHNHHTFLQPEVLRPYVALAGNLGCMVCLTPQLFLSVYPHANKRLSWSANCCSHHLAMCPLCPDCLSWLLLSVWMNVPSLTPWLSDFHTVQFSGSSGCFLFQNLLLSFFWLCKEAQCIYLCLHLGWPNFKFLFKFQVGHHVNSKHVA